MAGSDARPRYLKLPVGLRRVSPAKGGPIVYLGRGFEWLEGESVYVEIIVKMGDTGEG